MYASAAPSGANCVAQAQYQYAQCVSGTYGNWGSWGGYLGATLSPVYSASSCNNGCTSPSLSHGQQTSRNRVMYLEAFPAGRCYSETQYSYAMCSRGVSRHKKSSAL